VNYKTELEIYGTVILKLLERRPSINASSIRSKPSIFQQYITFVWATHFLAGDNHELQPCSNTQEQS